jgi:hypothetical protein
MEERALKEAFAGTNKGLGFYLAGKLSTLDRERFDHFKKSAEMNCIWGEVAYARYFEDAYFGFVQQDEKMYLALVEKAAGARNPRALCWLGWWFKRNLHIHPNPQVIVHHQAAAELGWRRSMERLAEEYMFGESCAKDLALAVRWAAKGRSGLFWDLLECARVALEEGETKQVEYNFDQFCFTIGWGLYWYMYDTVWWKDELDESDKEFGGRCLGYYCDNIEQQQKALVSFLLCWNETVGIKELGVVIAKMVWERRREEDLLQPFVAGTRNGNAEPERKRKSKTD